LIRFGTWCIATPETGAAKSSGSSRNQETLNSPLPFR
jgi:hypothetical protein